MATAKKSTVTKKSAAAKKTVVKRAPAKATAKTKVSHVRAKSAEVKSFRRAQPDRAFLTFKPSLQTFYWLVIAAPILILALWVANISAQVQSNYDQIDALNRRSDAILVPVTADTTDK